MTSAASNLTMTVEQLARRALAVSPSAIGPTQRAAARRALLDQVGMAAAAYGYEAASATRQCVRDTYATGRASVWFSGEGAHSVAAALANSTAGALLDGDDGHRAAVGHPGASIVPAALAEAEAVRADLDTLIAAIVVGYEVACRIGASRRWELVDAYATGHWCGYGAAAAVAFLRRLTPNMLARGFAIFGALRPVVYPRGFGMNPNAIKEAIPWATHTGMLAVGMAEAGLSGPENVFDDGHLHSDRVVEGFGEEPFFVESLYFKPYACCAWVHGAAEGLVDLIEQHAIALTAIRRVRVQTYSGPFALDNDPNPPTIYHAQYSYPFALAVAAHQGLDGLRPLSAASLAIPELVEFARRVELELDDEFEASFPNERRVRVVLETDTGTFTRQVDQERNPEDEAALAAKFRAMTRAVCQPGRQDRLINALLHASDARVLFAELRERLDDE